MSMGQLISAAYFGDSLLMLLLIWRLRQLGLHRRLPWFLSSLLLDLVVGYSGMATGFRSRMYCIIFGVSEPMSLLVWLFMTGEVFAGLHQIYPGLRILARRTFYASLGTGVLFAGLGISVTHTAWHYPGFQCAFFLFVELKRFISIGLIIFTPIMLIRLSRMPIAISRNTWVHGIIYSASLGITVLTSIFVLLRHDRSSVWWCNLCLQVAAIGCHCAWLAFLQREQLSAPYEGHIADDAIIGSLRRFNDVLQLICPVHDGARGRTKRFVSFTKDVFSRGLLRD